MIAYIIKSVLCLLVLWGFYKFALEQQAAHIFKRFFLLGSLALALVLPLITFTYTTEAIPQEQLTGVPANFQAINTVASTPVEQINWLPIIFAIIYAAGVLIFGFRFARNLYRLKYKIDHNEKIYLKSHINVLLNQNTVPHSFLKYIFLPKTEFKQHQIAQEVLVHEQTHVIQKHSWDILFIEFLQVLFWFNPLLVFIRKSVLLNHEFLADQAALREKHDVINYTNLLFQYSGGVNHATLSSPINYSLTKKRILMLTKSFSAKKLATRLTLLVPILALCIYFFNQDIVAQPMLQEKQDRISLKDQFEGKWKSTSQNIVFDIQDQNGGTLWDIIKNGEPPVRYYPKRTANGFYFSQGNEEIYYTVNGALMEDSNGNMYKKYQSNKKLTIYISDEKIDINSKSASIENFAKTIDEITANWTTEDMMNYSIQLRSKNGADAFLGKLANAFHNTRLYKTNPSKELLPPPPPPAPMNLSEFNSDKYKRAEITVEDDETIYVKGEKTNLSSLKEIVRENFPEWVTEDQKPRALTIIKGVNTSDSMIQEVYGTMQDFQINALNVVNKDASGVLNPQSQEQKIEKVINLKIYDQKINLDGKDVKLENLTSAINTLTKDWTAVDFEKYGFGLMQYPSTTDTFKNKVVDEIKKSDFYKKTGRIFLPPPPPPPVPEAPPAPTSPPTPDEMINQMTAAGADFYYNGDKITAEKAKQLFETKNNLNIISTEDKNGGNPMVLITDNK